MAKFQITLIRPTGFVHSEAFREIAETLQYGLRSIGHISEIRENGFSPEATNLILGAHLLTPDQAQTVPSGSIIYNLEQLGAARLQPWYFELCRQNQIWDYDPRNIGNWKCLHCAYAPRHVPIGYVPELTRIIKREPQDIGVLFYGSLNDRRSRILSALRDLGVKVHVAFGVYGSQRDELIARSKIVLNVHFYEAKVFEIVRVSYLLANSKAVVSECPPGTAMDAGLTDCIVAVSYESLVESCVALLRNDEERAALETKAFQWFSERKESDILSNALQHTPNVITNPSAPQLPRKLNLGSGKDWRPDYFNVDIDAYWEPDAVLDFNQTPPVGQSLDTLRFGTVNLENNYFDEIIANDALEHIRNLTTAMTSCLNLLRVGGVFRIAVPYDLSWGAWQDPTHVRAFNERSWLYYTDWFWYMGWTEARFDIASFDLGLSPIGEALKQQNMKGDDLVRYPRAVDQMRVALRKRLLTDAEKAHVQRYLQRPDRKPVASSLQTPTAIPAPSPAPQAQSSFSQITETRKSCDSPLAKYLQAAFQKANAGLGQVDPGVLSMDGMSGRKYRLFINNLINSMPGARYLEIGTWSGSTLCSAINKNSVKAMAIDNWSEFGGPKAQFLKNVERFRTGGAEVKFIENDFRKIDYRQVGRFNVYMFDGPHTAADQFDGLSLTLPALDDEFILIVDDWNHTPTRQGTLKAFQDLNLSVVHGIAIRTTLDGSHPPVARQASDWHNGYFIAVVSKQNARESLGCTQNFQIPSTSTGAFVQQGG